jgi:hypothetical protein
MLEENRCGARACHGKFYTFTISYPAYNVTSTGATPSKGATPTKGATPIGP